MPELPFSLGYQSIPLSPLISLHITSFLVPSVHSSVSLLIPFSRLSTSAPPACVYFLLPWLSSLNKAATATGLIPYAVQILIISYALRAQTCWALIIRAAAFNCIFITRQRHRFIMFRWRRSLKSVWTMSWNEGPAAMATIWWGRQGYLKEFSCCSRSRHIAPVQGKRQRRRKKRKHDWKINVEYCN